MTRFLRRAGLLAALALALTGALTAPASAAPAAAPQTQAATAAALDSSCKSRQTSFYVVQTSCFGFIDGRMYGQGGFDFQTGFNRDNVRKCSFYLQLWSNYNGAYQETRLDCTAAARAGGGYETAIYDFGPGRQAGDTYRLYAWIDVDTGAQYRGRSVAAMVQVTK